MAQLIVVCSVHRERGRCNAEALLHLLRNTAPSVVFTESPPAELASPQSLEGRALRAFTAHHQCQVVPIDDHKVSSARLASLARAVARVFLHVKQTSDDYGTLEGLRDHESFVYGFEYLNSRACEALNARLEGIEDQVVGQSGDEGLVRSLEEWRSVHELREQRMVRNIYRYSREPGFDRAVFLLGAAHKRGVLNKAALSAVVEAKAINWIGLDDQAEKSLAPEVDR